jgi:hypothetical protein
VWARVVKEQTREETDEEKEYMQRENGARE